MSGCSFANSFENVENGACNLKQAQAVEDHISKQIVALGDENFERAYSFAAESFQEDINLESFRATIETQYPMLIKNTGFEFNKCEIIAGEVLQIVEIKSFKKNYRLNYVLTLEEESLGIVAALIASISETTTI